MGAAHELAWNERVAISDFIQREFLRLLAMQGGWTARDFVFQGGTCLRLAYGSPRYSEDLDFYLHMGAREFLKILQDAAGARLETKAKASGRMLRFALVLSRDDWHRKVRVRVDGYRPHEDSGYAVCGMALQDGYVIPAGTQEALFGDKVVALAMRPRLKLRDFYDLWWLWQRLGRCDAAWVEASARLYGLSLQDIAQGLAGLDRHTPQAAELERDLSRWLPEDLHRRLPAIHAFARMRDEVLGMARTLRREIGR